MRSNDDPQTLILPIVKQSHFRPEIQGLRAVAIGMVIVYHIWFDRVSGGVDIFLFLTGFFITGSLLRMYERTGTVSVGQYLGRLSKRLLPSVAVVLLAVMVATYLWLPRTRWRDILDEVIASALYYENWVLAFNAVDYLEQDSSASPLQHFWSLSIQGQFYIACLLLVFVGILVARMTGSSVKRMTFVLLMGMLSVSLTYSVIKTSENQPWAYFDTGARLWEFALGGLLAIALPYIRVPQRLRFALGWLGLLALVSCGALVSVATLFPGYVALWPVGAAMLIVVAGTTHHRWGVDRLLGWKPFAWVGDLAYGLYLWHWPVLIVYLQIAGDDTAGLLGGIYVVAASVLLAWLTKVAVADRVTSFSKVKHGKYWSLAAGIVILLPVVTAAWLADSRLEQRQIEQSELIANAGDEEYPGANVLLEPELAESLPDVPMVPPLEDYDDLPVIYDNGYECASNLGDSDAIFCEYGDLDSDRSIAMVGASRTAHWFPALEEAANEHGWRLISVTKSGCQLAADVPLRDGEVFDSCIEWRDQVMAELEQRRPDIVWTSATRASASDEVSPPEFVEIWEQFADWGIDVIAPRDLPRLEEDMPECVAENGADACVTPVEYSHNDTFPALEHEQVPDSVTFIDLTEYVCPDGECPAVIGNVLTYRDSSHITATYAHTLAPVVAEEIIAATGWE